MLTSDRGRGAKSAFSFYNFLNMQATANKLADFPKIYLETNWYSEFLFIKLVYTRATTFDRRLFKK